MKYKKCKKCIDWFKKLFRKKRKRVQSKPVDDYYDVFL